MYMCYITRLFLTSLILSKMVMTHAVTYHMMNEPGLLHKFRTASDKHAEPGNKAKVNPVLTPDSLVALTKDNKCCLTKCVVMIYVHLYTGSELP